MNTIPCKECLKYPICKSKVSLNCTDLFLRFENAPIKDLFKIFPRLHNLGVDDGMDFVILDRTKRRGITRRVIR